LKGDGDGAGGVGSSSISRADLAGAMLASLEDPAAIRATLNIGY
jgi:putative NADH-flavin reductase